MVPPKVMYTKESVDVTLPIKMIFSGATKLRYLKWDHSGFRVNTNSNDKCPFGRKAKGKLRPRDRGEKVMFTQKKRLYLWYHKPRGTWRYQNMRGQERIRPQAVGGECGPNDTLSLNFWLFSELQGKKILLF